jgi:alginate O-acetyltransferase complex protein AlgI
MMQIYFDFSGYSDIAIGLGKLLGYDMKENFNFPYLSTSITDFWRRWHISLGTWFKEYIYIPLGGSRKSTGRTLINLAVVFLLTGLWHGAGWTFILWGAINGLFRILEKLMENSGFYEAIPSFFKWLVTMAIVYFCWIIFRFTDFKELIDWFKVMFGAKDQGTVPYTFLYYFDWQIIAFAAVAFFGSTILGIEKVKDGCKAKRESSGAMFFRELLGVVLFAVAIMFMVNSSYSPFMYFQY